MWACPVLAAARTQRASVRHTEASFNWIADRCELPKCFNNSSCEAGVGHANKPPFWHSPPSSSEYQLFDDTALGALRTHLIVCTLGQRARFPILNAMVLPT